MEEERVEYRQMGVMEELTGVKQPYNAGSNVVPFKRNLPEGSEILPANNEGMTSYDVYTSEVEDPSMPDFIAARSAWKSLEAIGQDPQELILDGFSNEIHGYEIKTRVFPRGVTTNQILKGKSITTEKRLVAYKLVKSADGSRFITSGEEEADKGKDVVALAERSQALVRSAERDTEGGKIIRMTIVSIEDKPSLVSSELQALPAGVVSQQRQTERDDSYSDFMGRDLSQFLPIKKAA